MTKQEKLVWAAAFALELHDRKPSNYGHPDAAHSAVWAAYSAVQALRAVRSPGKNYEAGMLREFRKKC